MSSDTLRLSRAAARNSSLVWLYLRPQWVGVVAATVLSATLGAISAVIGVLVGPCIQLVSGPRDAELSFAALFGPLIGDGIAGALGRATMPAAELLASVPLLLGTLALLRAAMSVGQWFLW